MSGMKKWLLVSIALMLLLLPTGISSEAGNGKSAKLLGPLPDLIEFYRTYDRMTDENWASFHKARLDDLFKKHTPRFAKGAPALPAQGKSKIRKNLPKGPIDFSSRGGPARTTLPFNRFFFDPSEQKKRGWSDDTFECIVLLQGNVDTLKQAGARIISSLPYNNGRIARIEVAGKKLETVSGLQVVRSMAPVLKRDLDNDLGSESTGATRLRVGGAGNWDPEKGFTGNGVVVGLIDTGIDWAHPDFIDPVTGLTRVQYIWDRGVDTTYARTPEGMFGGDLTGLDYGTVWTKAEIDGGSCTAYDTNSHGTHTSGTAAGNGYATGQYTGMAPNADIIMVQGLDNNGILFIYEMAKRMNKPCTVNMSYGPSYPMHYISAWPDYFPMDPTDSEGQWIDALNQYYGGGHIPVKSAGNIGHWNTYTDLSGGSYPKKKGGYHWGTVMAKRTAHILNVPDYDALWNDWFGFSPGEDDVAEICIGGWLERPGNVTITDPYGDKYTFDFGVSNGFVTWDGNVIVGMISSVPQANGSYPATFWIYPYYGYYGYSGAAVSPTQGQWKFLVAPTPGGKGQADFWVSDWNWYYDYEYPGIDWWSQEVYTTFADNSSHSSYIVDEGSTPFEITVGAWTTRQGWDSINGHSYTYTKKPRLNTIADFSSPGPARDHFMKPDIAAPGQIILSALSHSAAVNPVYIATDNAHQAMSGTSMSAPHVTGGVALLLQKFPQYTVPQVRYFLKNSAQKDIWTSDIGPNGFGAGKLNLRRLKSVPVAVLTVDKNVLVLSKNQTATLNGERSYDPDELPIKLKWVLVSSPIGANGQLIPNWNTKTATLIPDPNKTGYYTVGLIAEGTLSDSPMITVKIQAVK